MRNQIGIPPIDREADSSAPLGSGPAAPKASHHRLHVGMTPEVREGARHGEGADVGGFGAPVTERDTNAGLYIGLTIGVIAIILIVMLISAFL